jgi:hypothetical protein
MTEKKIETNDTPAPPTPGLLRRVELAAIDKVGTLLDIPEKPKAEKLHKLTPKQEAQLREIEENAIASFNGDLDVLESTLGMLRMGHHFGWRVLYLIHSKQTIRKYEDILGVRIRDIFPETGPSSYRSIGLNLADRFTNFWKVVGGEIKIPRRKSGVI